MTNKESAYVPKKGEKIKSGDILYVHWEGSCGGQNEIIWVDTIETYARQPNDCDITINGVQYETEYLLSQTIEKGLSLARIEAEYVKKVELGEIQRKRDEKLIKQISDWFGFDDFAQRGLKEVFASVDLECQANVKKCLDSEEKKEVGERDKDKEWRSRIKKRIDELNKEEPNPAVNFMLNSRTIKELEGLLK